MNGAYYLTPVPSTPQGLTLSEVTSPDPVGLLAEWSEVEEVVTGYTVQVTALGRGRDEEFSASSTRYTIESEAVGGYERVSVEVVAVNDAGYGPASEEAEGRTPPISMCCVPTTRSVASCSTASLQFLEWLEASHSLEWVMTV